MAPESVVHCGLSARMLASHRAFIDIWMAIAARTIAVRQGMQYGAYVGGISVARAKFARFKAHLADSKLSSNKKALELYRGLVPKRCLGPTASLPRHPIFEKLGRLFGAGSFLQHFFEFARLVQIKCDIATADEFPFYVELRKCWPIGEFGQRAVNLFVLVNIDVGILNATGVKGADNARGKSALRKIWIPLHINDDRVLSHLLFNAFESVHFSVSDEDYEP